MNIRPTQASALAQLETGLFANFAKLARAQEQVATGKRIVRPSDDPGGATRVIALGNQLATVRRYLSGLSSGSALLEGAASTLQDASGLMAQARSLVQQGANGTLSSGDKRTLAASLEQIRARLLEIANERFDGRYLFGGVDSNATPFTSSTVNGVATVRYAGGENAQSVQIGSDSLLSTGVAGSHVFAASERSGTRYAGFTGAAAGPSADQGSGYVRLYARHDSTSATLGSGLALANGGADDTLLGAHSLVVDSLAGTVQLDNGQALAIPTAGAANVADFVVTDENGAELHLDFSGYTGASYSGTVTGAGSLSLDGASYTALTFAENDLELIDNARGVVLHVDARNMRRAGVELVTFAGTVNTFDAVQGAIDDLNNVDGLSYDDLAARMSTWLDEIDRNHDNILDGIGELGALAQHARDVEQSLGDRAGDVEALRSSIEDADLGSVVLDMTRARQSLELVQATTARLLQSSLLDFLR